MQRSKEELEAAADVCERTAAHRGISGVAYPQFELAAKACRIVAAGMDGFEAIEKRTRETLTFLSHDVIEKSIAWARECYLAGRASASADVDALADEVTRLQNWCRNSEQVMAMFDTPQRVRDILAARRKEGKS